jgi:hypothetical protein
MLSNTDMQKLLDAIMKRGDRTYTTQSGAFLVLLRELAQESRISDMAEACAHYIRVYPMASAFVSAQVCPIIVNSYLPFLRDFPYDEFIQWSLVTPNWSDPIRNTFANPRLFERAISALTASVKVFVDQMH